MPEHAAASRGPWTGTPSLWYWAGGCIVVATLIARVFWYDVVTSDYTYFVRVWFDELDRNGLGAFASSFSDYAPFYLYLLNLLTVFPVPSLYSVKTLSLAFDALIAFGGYQIVKRTSVWPHRKDILFFCAALLFSLPTVAMNSSLWGQSDAVYAASVVWSLFFFLASMPLAAVLVFGLAISMKVQAIFFGPIVLGYLLRARETWKYVVFPAGVFVLTIIPAWIFGGNLRYWLFIYLMEAQKYPYLSVSAQSIYAFVQPLGVSEDLTTFLFWEGMIASGLVALGIVYLVARARVITSKFLVLISLASVLLLPYLLPRMHERYFYLADILSVLYAFYEPRRFMVPIIVVGTSLMSYMPFLAPQVDFLSRFTIDLRVPATLLLIPIGIVLYDLFREWRAVRVPPNVDMSRV